MSFLLTVENSKVIPPRPEGRIALLGRSNVGKSSLINAVLGGTHARVSKTPGRTQTVNWYLWKRGPGSFKILADLPGYGFAQASKDSRNQWARLAENYLRHDGQLEGFWVLWDSRHGPTKVDLEAIEFLSLRQVPVTIVMTKCDQLKTQSERVHRAREVHKEVGMIKKSVLISDPVVWISSRDGTGFKELFSSVKDHT